MFKIGEFSKISNTTVRTLRHYEKLGLMQPADIDKQSGYRFYEANQLTKINQIKLLQQVGLSLESIKDILEKGQMDVLSYYYEARESEINQELEQLAKKKKLIHQLQNQLKEGVSMEKYNVVLKTISPRRVISVRQVLPTFQDEGQLWEALGQQIQQLGVQVVPDSLPLTIFHDEEYRETNVEVEVQLEVAGEYEDTQVARFFDASELLIASTTFNGSFDQMPQVTQAIASWLEANDYRIAGPMINISHVSPGQEPDPAKWVTEAAFVVTKKEQ